MFGQILLISFWMLLAQKCIFFPISVLMVTLFRNFLNQKPQMTHLCIFSADLVKKKKKNLRECLVNVFSMDAERKNGTTFFLKFLFSGGHLSLRKNEKSSPISPKFAASVSNGGQKMQSILHQSSGFFMDATQICALSVVHVIFFLLTHFCNRLSHVGTS